MMPPSADVTPANFADAQFDQAVSDLEKILVEQRDELDPRTVMVIERNLTVIDEAIRQARAALDADPANTFLNSHLADSRRRKLDLLRRATTSHRPAATDRFQERQMNRISVTIAMCLSAGRRSALAHDRGARRALSSAVASRPAGHDRRPRSSRSRRFRRVPAGRRARPRPIRPSTSPRARGSC